LQRIPDTSSLLATYRVTTDDAGDIAGYERVRRSVRTQSPASLTQPRSPRWAASTRRPSTSSGIATLSR
jgi:Gas vesicle synthesis protein GvpO